MTQNHAYETGLHYQRQAYGVLSQLFSFWKGDPAEIYIFYRGTSCFRVNLAFFMSPMILNTSAPFAISGFTIQIKYSIEFLMTHAKLRLLALRNHLVTVLLVLFVSDSEPWAWVRISET